MALPEQPNSFGAIIKAGELTAPRRSEVHTVTRYDQGIAFFSPLAGKPITDMHLLRYQTHDAIAFTTPDREAFAIVAQRGSFIAVEMHGDPNGQANLAFRDNIAHARMNLVASFGAGRDVMYHDPSTVSGDTVTMEQSEEATRIMLGEGSILEEVQPSWYTEDWVTVKLCPVPVLVDS